ncbi:MAG TPA: serine/threonine-protein kinase [Gemmatimonadales bacterium]|nr:serine/threonine-protein kinase [Gemmatimonadales bacterium]
MAGDLDTRATLMRADSPPSDAGRRASSWTLPPDLLTEAVGRLSSSALLYALAYFLAAFLPALIVAERRAMLAANPTQWVPRVLSIGVALTLAWLASRRGIPARLKLYAALGFEVLGSFGIAVVEYQAITAAIQQRDMGFTGFGLSWVAAFVLLFSVVVPMPPRVMLLSTSLSVATVPLVYGVGMQLGINLPLAPGEFFFALVFPYLIIIIMAYVGSRIVYRLGAAVRQAREMGSYRLVQRLGEGGMGEVWRAKHRMLARPAAIKLIRPEVLGVRDQESRDVLLRRFEREAQATALMSSAHTLALYDFGVADDGTFYYVSELLDGFDLDQLVRQFGPVPAERAVHFLRQICASLAEAHEAGLIHRDIKPANVYACRYGREVDFIKVLDFGLVKRRPPDVGGDGDLTVEEAPSGTPAFMSPEQALGEARVDARSDLYAVGGVAYWLLTGTLVFKGATPMETIVMQVQRKPDPPSHRTELAIPPELESIVLDCLAKDPGDRPQSADVLAARLAAVPLEREWTESGARKWWDQHRPAGDRAVRALEEAVR